MRIWVRRETRRLSSKVEHALHLSFKDRQRRAGRGDKRHALRRQPRMSKSFLISNLFQDPRRLMKKRASSSPGRHQWLRQYLPLPGASSVFRAHVLRVLPRVSFQNFNWIPFRLVYGCNKEVYDTIAGTVNSHVPEELVALQDLQ